ncbi:MAG: hypothetical protein K6C94_01825 [Candidatus Gastranaerophilales bacterium]|nr:hypothetical protein [Candidatus Gastranaerophilales bacterium]
MARILENKKGRRQILLSADDIIETVREYQNLTSGLHSYEEIRSVLKEKYLFLPEEM